jgi:hypothetical protein
MNTQDSSGYQVDNRRQETRRAIDNTKAKDFLKKYTDRPGANLTQERREDDRFVVSGPGWGENFTFRNAFGAPNSPEMRRLSLLNQ